MPTVVQEYLNGPEYTRVAQDPEPDPVDQALDKFFESNKQVDEQAATMASALLDSSFYGDLYRSAKTTGANVASQVAGAPSDILGLMLMVRAADPVAGAMIKAKLGVDSAWDIPSKIPGNSEQIAGWIGGDPEHASWLPAGFVSPGPGELVAGSKALFIGPLGAQRLGGQVLEGLNNFRKGTWGPLDPKSQKETGWFNWFDEQPRHWMSDAYSKINDDYVRTRMINENIPIGEVRVIDMTIGEFFDHAPAYKAYPEMKDATLHLSVKRVGEDEFKVFDPNSGQTLGQFNELYPVENSNIELFKAADKEGLRSTMLHELQHFVQALEGFNKGTSTTFITKTTKRLRQQKAEIDLIKRFMEGDPPASEIMGMLKETYKLGDMQWNMDLYRRVKNWKGRGADFLAERVPLKEKYLKDTTEEARKFFSYLGDDLEDTLATAPQHELRLLIEDAYFNTSGEVEPRVVEYLRNQIDGEVTEDVLSKINHPTNVDSLEPGVSGRTQIGPSPQSIEDTIQFPRHRTKRAQETRAWAEKRDAMWEELGQANADYDEKWGKEPWLYLDEDPFFLQRVAFKKGVNPEKMLAEIKKDTADLDALRIKYNEFILRDGN